MFATKAMSSYWLKIGARPSSAHKERGWGQQNYLRAKISTKAGTDEVFAQKIMF